jgi:phage virion morphogenesis protein
MAEGLILKVSDESMKNLRRRMNAIKKRSRSPEPAWRKVGSYLSSEVRKQFVSEGAYFGEPWKPLTPKYKTWKLAHGGINKILRFNGDMMRSFTSRPMDIERYMGHEAEYGSSDRLAVFHHGGTHRHGKQVNPARPILVLTPDMSVHIRQIIANYLMGRQGKDVAE